LLKECKRQGAQNWISEEGAGRFKYQDSFLISDFILVTLFGITRQMPLFLLAGEELAELMDDLQRGA